MIRLLIPGLLLLSTGAQTLDQYIEARRKDWNIPGLAVAVVKDGRIVHQGVYGYRDVEQKKPVTRQTLFGIGSLTKSFTALLLASLVEEGKLDWDRPVRQYSKEFALKDPTASEQATLRDLLSHRTGLPRHDALWASTRLSRGEIFQRLRFLDFNKTFRSRWEYNNLMYMAAGVIAEHETGRKWEDLVRARLFAPLGWKRANVSVSEFAAGGDWAENYDLRQGKMTRVEPRNLDNVAPAGSINASIEEMTGYLQVHLQAGMLGGRRVFPAAWLEVMRTAQMVKPPADIPGEGKIDESYGLGLFITTHRGRRMIWHTGTIGGYHALMAYLPDDRIGFVSLQNRVMRPLPQLLARHIFDTLLGVAPPDWNARYQEADRKASAPKPAAPRKESAKPAHEYNDYAGTYRHPGYGDVSVSVKNATLEVAWGARIAPATPWHYDVFAWGGNKVRFVTLTDGTVGELYMELEPALGAETLFRRN